MDALLQDIRYGWRMLLKSPGFSVVAVLTLALGIGANTAIFTVLNTVMLRFLPVHDPQQLVLLHTSGWPRNSGQTGEDTLSFNYASFDELRKQKQVFSDVMGFVPLGIGKIAVRYGDTPEEARGDMVSANFFSGLGVRMEAGRGFIGEDEAHHAATAVLSYGYWSRRFGRDPKIIGQTIFIKSVPFTIVGVTGREFDWVGGGGPTDLWVPIQTREELPPWGQAGNTFYGSPRWWFLMMVGRVAPGVTPERALAQAQPVFQSAAYQGVGTPAKDEKLPELSFTALRGIAAIQDAFATPLNVLMGMVALVLVIACSNVAMLLIARNTARQREFCVRVALGATRAQLFRQLLMEGILLVAAGGALGWLFARWTANAFAKWAEFEVAITPDWRVLVFALVVSSAAALLFGMLPLRGAARIPPAMALKTGAVTSGSDRSRFRSARIVVAAQIALCLALLVGAGLLVRTLRNLQNEKMGMRTEGLAVFGVAPPQALANNAEVLRFYQSLTEKLRALPGVEAVTLVGNRPGGGWSNNTNVRIDGALTGINRNNMRWNLVGPEFCKTLGIPLLLGRDFTDADNITAQKVVIVTETFAKTYFEGRNPVGHQLSLNASTTGPQWTIIGVASDSKYTAVRERTRAVAYFPYMQLVDSKTLTTARTLGTLHFELRSAGSASVVLEGARRLVHEFGPDLPLLEPTTQQEQFAKTYVQERLFARLSMGFGVLAAVLVATGLYGTLAYRVNRRTAEIGVRMALGAQRGQVLWMVLRENLVICAAGVAVGIPLSIGATRFLRSMLFGLTPGDPLTFVLALVGLVTVALTASLLPAQRAARVEPMVALRYE